MARKETGREAGREGEREGESRERLNNLSSTGPNTLGHPLGHPSHTLIIPLPLMRHSYPGNHHYPAPHCLNIIIPLSWAKQGTR